MNKAKPLQIAIIILILVVIGGFLIYQHWGNKGNENIEDGWTEPTTSQASGVIWSGIVQSINLENKMMEIISMPGELPLITIFFPSDIAIKDDAGNTLSIGDIKIGDVVSASGEYQMKGKLTDEWQVRINEVDRIVVLGVCTKEGGQASETLPCCLGLDLIEQKYCTKCGDGLCKEPENENNCPLDCVAIGDVATIKITNLNVEGFNLNDKSFQAQVWPKKENIKVMTNDQTEIYTLCGENSKCEEDYTFSEFYYLIEGWTGPMAIFTVEGTLLNNQEIQAQKIFYQVQ